MLRFAEVSHAFKQIHRNPTHLPLLEWSACPGIVGKMYPDPEKWQPDQQSGYEYRAYGTRQQDNSGRKNVDVLWQKLLIQSNRARTANQIQDEKPSDKK